MRSLMMDRVLACIHLTDEVDWIRRERSNGYAATNATRLPSRCSWILLHLPIPYFCYLLASVFPELICGYKSWLMWLRGLGDGGVSVEYYCLSARTPYRILPLVPRYESACLRLPGKTGSRMSVYADQCHRSGVSVSPSVDDGWI